MRNRQMIVGWLMANSRAIEVRRRDSKTYYVVVDVKAFQEGVGRLLADVQRIKAEGDYEAAKALFETYGVHFDPALRDEVVARVDRLQMPSYTGFVQPRLEAVRNAGGEITDVRISYPLDLTAQMLEYSGRRIAVLARRAMMSSISLLSWRCRRPATGSCRARRVQYRRGLHSPADSARHRRRPERREGRGPAP